MTELEGRVALARIDLEKARLLAGAAQIALTERRHSLRGLDADQGPVVAHGLAVLEVRAAEVRLAVAESALARSLS